MVSTLKESGEGRATNMCLENHEGDDPVQVLKQ